MSNSSWDPGADGPQPSEKVTTGRSSAEELDYRKTIAAEESAHQSGIGNKLKIAGLIVAVLMGLLTWASRPHDQQATPDATTAIGTAPSPLASAHSIGLPSLPSVPGSCVDQSGRETACSRVEAQVPAVVDNCTVTEAAASLGLDANVLQLDLAVTTSGGRCAVSPGEDARAEGALAEDVMSAANGDDVAPALLQCARRTQLANSIPCSQPHEFEWIGPWVPSSRAESADCQQRGRVYTEESLTDPGRMKAVVAQASQASGPASRCAIVTETRTGSVRLIRGGALD
ncbi:MAG: hypothetical protein LWW86_04830 [Micrococcales bacterium]|nr:hypothetical protein [Micrococcales bacterium]